MAHACALHCTCAVPTLGYEMPALPSPMAPAGELPRPPPTSPSKVRHLRLLLGGMNLAPLKF